MGAMIVSVSQNGVTIQWANVCKALRTHMAHSKLYSMHEINKIILFISEIWQTSPHFIQYE
jgi:hypothetical protein